ncbi:MAG: hypothetical protein JST92_08720, partial [Deltaproteobacteria bacterium]|nr:hypothetical protein [Deltaproteobacteria bacterium]
LVEALPAAPLLLLSFEATGPHAAQEAEDEGQEALRVASGAGTGGEDLGPGSLERLIERKEPLGGRRRALEQAGAFVDALDVATTWDKAPALLGALRRAAGTKALVTARAMSPALEGCAIDLNIVGLGGPTSEPASGVHEASEDLLEDLQKAEERHDAVIAQVLNAAADAGATLSHHRGVGLQRKLLLPREHGEGMRQLRALKKAFDPQGILNPGKLLL